MRKNVARLHGSPLARHCAIHGDVTRLGRGWNVNPRRRVRSPYVTPLRLVMRLASQPHCPWGERGSIPLRGAGLCRPSRSESHGDQLSLQNSERRFDSFPACHGIVAQRESARFAPGRCEFKSRRFHRPSRPREGHRKTSKPAPETGRLNLLRESGDRRGPSKRLREVG